jgi:hypothetical protein
MNSTGLILICASQSPNKGDYDYPDFINFNNLESGGGYTYEQNAPNLLSLLADGFVMLVFLHPGGTDKPSHCEGYHCKDDRLLCNGAEIDGEIFNNKIFCHEKNQYILGRRKIEDLG